MRLARSVLLLLSFFLLTPPLAWGQQPLSLTLQDAIRRAQENSPASKVAHLQFERSAWDYRVFSTRFFPSLSIGGSAPGLIRSISNVEQDDGSMRYVPQSRTFSSLGFSVEQELPMTGGRLFLSSGLSRIDLFGDIGSNQWQSSPLVVGLEQPLFQFNEMKWARRTEPLRFQIAEHRLAEDLAEAAVRTTDLFFEVVIAQLNVERAAFNVAVNDTIYTLSQGRYELGKIAENDLLQSELALLNAQTERSDARIAYERALQDLKIALDLAYDAAVAVLPPFETPAFDVDPTEAVAQARLRRADFLSLQMDEIEAQRDVAETRAANRFSASLTASYGLNQSAEFFGDVYRNPLNQQRLSLRFQVPIYQWGRGRAAYESALAEQERVAETVALRRREIEQEVYFEALQLQQLQQQVRLAAKADTIAARRFEVARNRYTIGTIDITDLFDAQQAKDTASQAYIRTLRQFWVSFFRLRRLTLFDFARGRPVTNPYE